MKPVIIRINKKTIEPSPSPKHDYRICFRFKGKINYDESEGILKCVGNPNIGLRIETDAQFAKWLVDNLGLGNYLVFVWKKRRKGFCTFYFNCSKPNKFKQIKKKKTMEEEEKDKLLREIKKHKNRLKNAESDREREEIKKEIEDIYTDVEADDEIINLEQDTAQGKIKIFKNIQPLYKEHSYENYGGNNGESNKYDSSIW